MASRETVGTASGFALTGNFVAAAGVLVAGTLFGLLRGRDRPKSAFDTTRRRRVTTRFAEQDAQWVLGRARTGGAALFEDARQWSSGGDSASDTARTRYLYLGRLLTQGSGAVEAVWYDDVPVPLQASAESPFYGRFESYNDGFATELAGRYARQNALVPGSRDADNAVVASVLAAADPVARLLWDDLQADVEAWIAARTFNATGVVTPQGYTRRPGWRHEFSGGVLLPRGDVPALRVSVADGGRDPVQEPAYLRALDKVSGWQASDRVEGVTWAMVELRNWEAEKPPQSEDGEPTRELVPFPTDTVPNVEFLVEGDRALANAARPELGANPVLAARWFLTARCGVPANRLVDFDAAAAACDAPVSIPAVAPGDPEEPTAAKPITGPQVLDFYYADRPALEVQTRVLNEWNQREAGLANARARYAANGIVDASMSRADVLDALGACMGGHFVEVGGNWYARPGVTRTPEMVVVEADVVGGAVRWKPDAGAGRAPNGYTATIAQDRNRDWRSTAVPAAVDDVFVDRDGAGIADVGGLDLVNDMLDAQRLLHLYLRRDAYGLVRCAWQMKVATPSSPAAQLVPTDVVQLQADGRDMRVRLTSVQYRQGVVRVEGVESPSDVFEVSFHVPSTLRDFTAQPGDDDYDLSCAFETTWRANAGQTAHELDLTPRLGADVGSLRVQVAVTHARGAMDGAAIEIDYVVASAPPSGAPLTVEDGSGSAFSTVASADWDVRVTLTPYSERPYTEANMGVDAGAPVSTTLKGPGAPGGVSGGGLGVDYWRILRDTRAVGARSLTSLTVLRLRPRPATATLVWKFAADEQWRAFAPEQNTAQNWQIARNVVFRDRWDWALDDVLNQPAERLRVMFAARQGTEGVLGSPGVVAKVADLSGATVPTTEWIGGFCLHNGVAYFSTRARSADGALYTVSLTTGAVTRIGATTTGSGVSFARSLWSERGKLKGLGNASGGSSIFTLDPATGAISERVAPAGLQNQSPVAAASVGVLGFRRTTDPGFNYRVIDSAAGTGATATAGTVGAGITGRLAGAASDFDDVGVLLLWSATSSTGAGVLARFSPATGAAVKLADMPSVQRGSTAGGIPWESLARDDRHAYAIAGRALYRVTGLWTPGRDLVYSEPLEVPALLAPPGAQLNKRVTAKPTVQGDFDGQLSMQVQASG